MYKRKKFYHVFIIAQEIKNKWLPYLHEKLARKSCNFKGIKILQNTLKFLIQQDSANPGVKIKQKN